MNNRKYYNKQIIDKLNRVIEEHPDLRFGQLLVNSNIVQISSKMDDKGLLEPVVLDPFYDESSEIFNRIKSI